MILDKEQSGRRWIEIRARWNQWDPIGVSPDNDGPQDEYDSYLGPSLRLLERSASQQEITEYLSHIVAEYMGLGAAGIQYSNPSKFASELQEWFSANWAGTDV